MAHRLRPAMLWPIIFAALALPYVEVSARACSCRAHIRKASRKRWQSNASKRLKPVREMGLEPTRQRHRNLNPARLPIPPYPNSNFNFFLILPAPRKKVNHSSKCEFYAYISVYSPEIFIFVETRPGFFAKYSDDYAKFACNFAEIVLSFQQ